jgi:hypothetical protein
MREFEVKRAVVLQPTTAAKGKGFIPRTVKRTKVKMPTAKLTRPTKAKQGRRGCGVDGGGGNDLSEQGTSSVTEGKGPGGLTSTRLPPKVGLPLTVANVALLPDATPKWPVRMLRIQPRIECIVGAYRPAFGDGGGVGTPAKPAVPQGVMDYDRSGGGGSGSGDGGGCDRADSCCRSNSMQQLSSSSSNFAAQLAA